MADVIALRDLPGVAKLEAALHVPGRQLLKEYDDLEERIQQLSRRLFGIVEDDTYYIPKDGETYKYHHPDGVIDALTPEGEENHEEWEKHFEFLEYEYGEEDVFWAAMGWDVTDGQGTELEIMNFFGRQLVCVVKRLHPRARLSLTGEDPLVPATAEDAERQAEEWGRRLKEEARNFKPRRR